MTNKELEIYKINLKELQSDYTNSIYVILENQETKKKYYTEINDRKGSRKATKFTPDKAEIIYADKCQKNNHFYKYDCYLTNENDEKVIMTNELERIIELTSNIEHDIIKYKIMKVNNEYFIILTLNVNLWTSYELYYYNNKSEKLIEIETFDNCDVVGIKLKN